ncbi:Phage eae protein [Escherichia coli]|uniref:hypothetical protein n=1 Tax=Escherichia coli TaxID=562 RepID=UPI0009458479|nr:hypothetical protein [Escherichia coli]EFD1702246.1 hypothetical protein [Escherichia coli]EHT6895847.1 hypothetical protein [Escherichia coli]OKU48308.1 hypothetical protein ACN79_03245 [Escherichia coli]SMB25324.1 Phage eae protein [Escherichia coli]SMB25325.1 Phage eae protein [Escherichia coli]
MKQITLIEMDGFLKGKCIPSDLKVNETNAEYLVRKFGELESKLETALRECRSAGITIDNLEAKCAALAAENARLKAAHPQPFGHEMMKALDAYEKYQDEVPETGMLNAFFILRDSIRVDTQATDAFLAEVRAQGVEMYADNLDNGADDAERGGFDDAVKFLRSEASGVRLFADQLRKGGNQ